MTHRGAVPLRVVLLLIGALTLVSAVAAYLHERDRRVAAVAAASARIARDSATLDSLNRRRPSLDTVLVESVRTVRETLRRTDTLVRTMPPETVRESVYVAQLDTLSRSCSAVALACQAYRDTAEASIANLMRQNADLRTLSASQPSRGRIRFGVGLGYGTTYDLRTERLVHGPSLTFGITITP